MEGAEESGRSREGKEGDTGGRGTQQKQLKDKLVLAGALETRRQCIVAGGMVTVAHITANRKQGALLEPRASVTYKDPVPGT